jgi:hypothetical protein
MYLLYPEGRSQVASLFADAWFHGFPERTLAGWGLLWRELASRLVRVQCDFSIDLLAVEGSLGTLACYVRTSLLLIFRRRLASGLSSRANPHWRQTSMA